jgi:hypothetical protein
VKGKLHLNFEVDGAKYIAQLQVDVYKNERGKLVEAHANFYRLRILELTLNARSLTGIDSNQSWCMAKRLLGP